MKLIYNFNVEVFVCAVVAEKEEGMADAEDEHRARDEGKTEDRQTN